MFERKWKGQSLQMYVHAFSSVTHSWQLCGSSPALKKAFKTKHHVLFRSQVIYQSLPTATTRSLPFTVKISAPFICEGRWACERCDRAILREDFSRICSARTWDACTLLKPLPSSAQCGNWRPRVCLELLAASSPCTSTMVNTQGIEYLVRCLRSRRKCNSKR